ncbi:MAG: metallophosphoesterase [Verrucomicrobiales bacterium]
MRTLIIPDLHHHTDEAEDVIARIPADRVVFLGDYFDNFGDTPEVAARTARWLRDSLGKADRVHLFGNHDLPYAFPRNASLYCPGWTPEKNAAVGEVLRAHHWAQLRLLHLDGRFALCHAGLSPDLFAHPLAGIDPDRVAQRCAEALDHARAKIPDPALGWGLGMDDPRAGITWLRWWLLPVSPPLCQIVGHTPARGLRVERGGGCFNVCLDTFGEYVGLIDGSDFFAVRTGDGEAERIF